MVNRYEFQLADRNMRELGMLQDVDIDINIGNSNDFEVTVPFEQWDGSIKKGYYIYSHHNEYGGIVGEFKSSTKTREIFVRGYTWRGMLGKKIIRPDPGEDYRVVKGELNEILRDLINEQYEDLFEVSGESTGVIIGPMQLDRYCTLLDGITKILDSVGYRLDIRYVPGTRWEAGYVLIGAEKIQDHSETIEYSQDGYVEFTATKNYRGINHLICLGKGELKDRKVIDLYVQEDGSIEKDRQHYKGIEEIAEIYDYSNAEEDELYKKGIEKLKNEMNSSEFKAEVDEVEEDWPIGDSISGRDYISGIEVSQPIIEKNCTVKDGEIEIEYKIGGREGQYA